MTKFRYLKIALAAGASVLALNTVAHAENFNIPGGYLDSALDAYVAQSGVRLAVANDAIEGVRTNGAKGDLPQSVALARILKGTGFVAKSDASGVIGIVRGQPDVPVVKLMQATPARVAAAATTSAGIESVVVTSSKIKGDIQTVPIAITALSQEQLTSRQIAGGPDLVKEVPNLTFTKTNFTGYSIQIRGIGTQAISVTTDPAVAVALNDTPFIRNHFFEQEFYDVGQLEVLRGPQGTLYGRNATAGVVNIVSAKPTDQFEAMASADWGNYHNRRYEGMINIPIVDDRVDVRIAGEWTKREGYTVNENTGDNVDGRDLWSSRVTIGWKPTPELQAYVVWEHFQESDDRMRTAKQLCHNDPGRTSIGNVSLPTPASTGGGINLAFTVTQASLSQGCLPASLYSPELFQVPNGYALPYVISGHVSGGLRADIDPYASTVQSRDLRVIETQIDPRYSAKNDTVELNADYNITPALTFTSQTGYNQDFLYSTEDYNRFNTSPGIFHLVNTGQFRRDDSLITPYSDCRPRDNSLPADGTYYFDDPQLGCSNRLVAQDVSSEHAWQLSQEFRLASNFTGPLNFSAGGNYMHYETEENYYVFANTLTMFAATSGDLTDAYGGLPVWDPGVSDNHECLSKSYDAGTGFQVSKGGLQYSNPANGPGTPTGVCYYIDPNPLSSLNNGGHNYFLSKNPYVLNSYAAFGEVYYDILSDLKLTSGVRWTDDQKRFIDIPSELLVGGFGYANTGAVDQQWNKLTGRLAANWTPKLDFTDQTLVYGSYARGYKAGGANPPGAVLGDYGGFGGRGIPTHPLTFDPEFVDAYELGSKNTLLDGGLTLNGDVFFYNYKGYQISEIVDRTSINLNFDATVKGAELEASYEPVPGLKFNLAGGYESTRIAAGSQAVDLMDRTAGHPGWVLMRPFVTESSNCIFPDYVVAALADIPSLQGIGSGAAVQACGEAYTSFVDPVTQQAYNPSTDIIQENGTHYHGYDPVSADATNNGAGPAPNNGAGFSKDLSGNQLPNAPHFTTSFSAEYTTPVSENWAATLHSDFYWQSQSWARVFNDVPYDKIRGYSNVNLALILTSAEGWQVMGYLKNVFDTTAITGAFLNSDDSGLTTNVFLTDPRLYGVRITKNW